VNDVDELLLFLFFLLRERQQITDMKSNTIQNTHVETYTNTQKIIIICLGWFWGKALSMTWWMMHTYLQVFAPNDSFSI